MQPPTSSKTNRLFEAKQSKSEWTRSETLALAHQSCSICYGLGLKEGRAGMSIPCNCVFRTIFRACYGRFRQCASKEKYISRVSLESTLGRQRKSTWGLKDEEFIADFCLVSRRSLSARDYRIFKFHYLLGADWKLCCRRLNLDRGSFYHEVYRIEQKLGRTFRELKPYALFPIDEYFNSTGKEPVIATTMFKIQTEDLARTGKLLRFPVKSAA